VVLIDHLYHLCLVGGPYCILDRHFLLFARFLDLRLCNYENFRICADGLDDYLRVLIHLVSYFPFDDSELKVVLLANIKRLV